MNVFAIFILCFAFVLTEADQPLENYESIVQVSEYLLSLFLIRPWFFNSVFIKTFLRHFRAVRRLG